MLLYSQITSNTPSGLQACHLPSSFSCQFCSCERKKTPSHSMNYCVELSGFPASHLPHLEMAPLLRCQPYAQSCSMYSPSWYLYSRTCLHTGTNLQRCQVSWHRIRQQSRAVPAGILQIVIGTPIPSFVSIGIQKRLYTNICMLKPTHSTSYNAAVTFVCTTFCAHS